MNQASGMGQKPFARITLLEAGKEKKSESQGDGPVDEGIKFLHYDDVTEGPLDAEEEVDEEMGADI